MLVTLSFLNRICYMLGATDELLMYCRNYLMILVIFTPACMLQSLFQSYLVTAERPTLGLILIILAGVLNVCAGLCTDRALPSGNPWCRSCNRNRAVGTGDCGLIFFFANKKGLCFTRFQVNVRDFLHACYNGSSEMVSQLAAAIITFLFNSVMMRLAGANGVAAITIILYGEFLFNSFHLGFAVGIAPIVGFQYGAQNKAQLKRIYKTTFIFVVVSSVVITVVAALLAKPIVSIFTKDLETWELASVGFQIFAINFLFSGVNIASSGFLLRCPTEKYLH